MDLREIRRIYDIRDILGLSSNQDKIVCPLPQHHHSNYTPSFSIFRGTDGVQRFECHGNCGLRGDVIDLVGYMKIPAYDDHDPGMVVQAVQRLSSIGTITVPQIERMAPALAPNAWVRYHQDLGQTVVNYAGKRGINLQTLQYFRVGQSGSAMTMPAFERGVLKAIKFRNTSPNSKLRYWSQKGSQKTVFNFDGIYLQSDPILVVKAEIPTMLLWQHGFKVCASTGGEKSSMAKWAPAFSMSKRIVVVADNDKDPKVRENIMRFTRQRAKDLGGIVKAPPERFKDIDDWILAAGGTAIEQIRQWLEE